ncbi:MAG: response regulator transcription factor [Lachnospiraceae bacterium]|jgi:two-component system response regulator VanR|nr:response regulator transcription factor [Lachnospiraceae bacterium]
MADKIMIVDDEPEIADLIEVYLKSENYAVTKFYSAAKALEAIQTTVFDLAILDIMLPDINGFELCQRIREKHTYPIIMLTAKDEETDKITGLVLGADDYVTKPFRPLELIARVKAQLRRYKQYGLVAPADDNDSESRTIMGHGALVLNVKTHECHLDNRPLSLTPTEFDILRILLERKGLVVSAEEIFHTIWQDEYYNKANNTITVHIRHLREKMNDTVDKPQYIKTIWGVGYKIGG